MEMVVALRELAGRADGQTFLADAAELRVFGHRSKGLQRRLQLRIRQKNGNGVPEPAG